MSRHLLRYAALVVALLGSIATAVPASATPYQKASVLANQHQHGNIQVLWNFRGATGFWNIDQRVYIPQKARKSYWAMQWGFTATPNDGGYMGLQTNAQRPNGTFGDIALFALWNANAVRGANCGPFSNEGEGFNCRLAYPIDEQGDYRFRVWRLDADAGGQWWGAWIMDARTGAERHIGALRVAANKTLMTTPLNFSEYWGDQTGCDNVPLSTALFTQPAANQQRPGIYQYGSEFASSSRGSCTGGGVSVVDLGWTKAARTTLGGAR